MDVPANVECGRIMDVKDYYYIAAEYMYCAGCKPSLLGIVGLSTIIVQRSPSAISSCAYPQVCLRQNHHVHDGIEESGKFGYFNQEQYQGISQRGIMILLDAKKGELLKSGVSSPSTQAVINSLTLQELARHSVIARVYTIYE